VGLATVLITIGLSLVWGKKVLEKRVSDSPRAARLGMSLGIVGALFVMAIGFWLCIEALS
jgi:malonyl CoA-acyl carrier protein transacylase